jgi:hypothetical protein
MTGRWRQVEVAALRAVARRRQVAPGSLREAEDILEKAGFASAVRHLESPLVRPWPGRGTAPQPPTSPQVPRAGPTPVHTVVRPERRTVRPGSRKSWFTRVVYWLTRLLRGR